MMTMLRPLFLLALALLLTAGVVAGGQLADGSTLSHEGAKAVMAAAVAEARSHQAGGAIAVVDAGGYVLCIERLDGTFHAAPEIALGKAQTAAAFQRPTKVFEDLINQGRTTMVTLPHFTPLQGGVPIRVGERVVGAIGVSGAASAQQDEEIAMAGAKAAEDFKIAGSALSSSSK